MNKNDGVYDAKVPREKKRIEALKRREKARKRKSAKKSYNSRRG